MKKIVFNRQLSILSSVLRNFQVCCSLIILLMASGTAWAQDPDVPPNDLCSGAIAIACGDSLTGSTVGATPELLGTCGTSQGSGGAVWYVYTGDINGLVTASMCESDYDSKLQVYSGACGDLTCIGGDDDAFSDGCGNDPFFIFDVEVGVDYYILVTGFSSNEGNYGLKVECAAFDCQDLSANIGDACDDLDETTQNDAITADCECAGVPFDCPELLANIGDACDDLNENTTNDVVRDDCVCAGFLPPANDLCDGAIAVVCGETASGSTLGATSTTLTSCGTSLSSAPGVWYSLSNFSGTVSVTTCSEGGPEYDTKLGVFSGSCDALVCVGGDDDASTGDTELDCTIADATANRASFVEFEASADETYYIYVTGFSTNFGNFDLTVSCVEPLDCPDLEANIGDACDDLDETTENDVVSADCVCAGTPIPVAPANDNCADAEPISCGDSVEGTTLLATNSDFASPSCAGGTPNDVFYTLDVIPGTVYTVTVNGDDYDGVLVIYSGSCEIDDQVELGCSDSGFTSGIAETIEFSVEVAQTVIIRTYDWSSTQGSFVLSVSCAQFDCPDLAANIGDACDDLDETTQNDAVTADCECAGVPFDCPELLANIGDACDDLNENTTNDVVRDDCVCAGFLPPANDLCDGAIAVVCGETASGSTLGATSTTLTSCGTSLSSAPGVWYSLSNFSGTVSVTTCSEGGPEYDTKLGVFSGSCDALVCVGGDDDASTGDTELDCTIADATANRASFVEFEASADETYYIYVTGFSSNIGNFDLTVSCIEPLDCPDLEANIGDACDDLDETTENDVVGDDCVCAGTPIVIFDCPDLEANIGDACDDLDETTENDVVTADCECAGTPIDLTPVNDLCSGAIAIACGDSLTGSTVGATPELLGTCGTSQGTGGAVWYVYTGDINGLVTASMCESDYDSKLQVYSGACGDLTCIGGDDDAFAEGCGNDPFFTFESQVGVDYYILVTGFSSNEGNYGLKVECAAFDCQDLSANIGDACDDLDETTQNDAITADCECAGVPFDCPELLANIGDACDDLNENTTNDVVRDDCVCAGFLPPANDLCSGAIAVVCGETASGSTLGATSTTLTSCGTSLSSAPGVWYSLSNFSGTVSVTTCSEGGPEYDTKLGVFSGSCDALVCVGGDDDASTGDTELDCTIADATANRASFVEFEASADETYYIYVTGFSTNFGNFDLTVSCIEPLDCPDLEANIGDACDDLDETTENDVVGDDCVCAGTPIPVAPANDNCADAEPISCGDSVEGTTLLATNSDFASPSCAGGTPADVFYTLDVIPGTVYTVTVNGDDYDGVLVIYSGSCEIDDQVELGCSDSGFTSGIAETIEFSVEVAQTVIIRTYDWSSTQGSFVLSVSCALFDCPDLGANIGDACDDLDETTDNDVVGDDCVCAGTPIAPAPENDLCSGAIALECGTIYTGSNVTATEDEDCGGAATPGLGVWYTLTVEEASTITLETCFEGTDFDTDLNIFTGSCDDLTCFSGFSGDGYQDGTAPPLDACTGTFPLNFRAGGQFDAAAGVTYYILLSGYSAGDEGNFELLVSCEVGVDCPELGLNIGADCDDLDPTTYDDVVGDDCVCAGTPYDCPDLLADIGDSCDDLDATTFDDVVGDDCVCAGTPYDCPDLLANIGDACDDLDPNTTGDAINADCECIGNSAPANDLCEGAIPVQCDEVVSGSTLGASIAPDLEFCGTSLTSAPGVWYVIPGFDGTISLTTCSEGGPAFDTKLGVFSGSCDALVCVGGNDDGNTEDLDCTIGDATPVRASSLSFSSSAEETYYIYVTGFGSNAGDFDLTISCQVGVDCPDLGANIGDACDDLDPNTVNDVVSEDCECAGTPIPSNNDCENAIALNCGDSVEGTTVAATESDLASPECANGSPSDVFYTLDVMAGAEYTVSINGADYDGVLVLYTGTCDDLVEFACADNGFTAGVEESITFTADADETIVIRTYDWSSTQGSFTINVTCEQEECENFVYYLADFTEGLGTDIYEVSLGGSDANMEFIANIADEVHIAYNNMDNQIYAVSKNNNEYKTLNPHVASPAFSAPVSLGGSYGQITGAGFAGDGSLLIADQIGDVIYEVNTMTSVVSVYDAISPIFGGDITSISSGMVYLSTNKDNGSLFEVFDSMDEQLISGLPLSTGIAATASDQLILSTRNSMSLGVYNTDGTFAGSFNLVLEGNPFTHGFGDLASGCNTYVAPEPSECENLATFYAEYDGVNNQTDIYSVVFSGNTATLTEFVSDVDGNLSLSFDGANNTLYGTPKSFTSSNGVTLSSVTAAVFNPTDGLIYIGDDVTNAIYTEDLVTGAVTFYANGFVRGGDLAITSDGSVYLATQTGNSLYEVNNMGGSDFVSTIPELVTGAARSGATNGILLSNKESNVFTEIDATTGNVVNAYDISIDGASFTTKFGDLAAGCVDVEAQALVMHVTGISSVEATSVLTSLPNPTTGLSQVVFTTAETGRTLVEVYDMSGRNIATLFNQEAQEGEEYRLDFNGSALPNGVYVYRLTTQNETVIEKFMIAK